MNSAQTQSSHPLSGVLVLDKPLGISSNAALGMAKRLLRADKAGHTGSLDPEAGGVLPLCFGAATKLSQFLLEADKKYTASFAFGCSTSTGDAAGEPRGGADASQLRQEDVERAMGAFRGAIEQIPPMFSAIKQGGKPLYKLARQGLEVERAPRTVHVHELRLLEFVAGRMARADVVIHCSKGTYVRSLAQDLGSALGCGGHVLRLRRSRSGPFREEDGVSLERLREYCARSLEEARALLRPAEEIVRHLPEVRIDSDQERLVRQGGSVPAAGAEASGKVRIKTAGGLFIGVGEVLPGGRLQPRRMLSPGHEDRDTRRWKESWH